MFAETESLPEPGAHGFFSAAKPARLKVPFVSASLEWDYRCMLCSAFYTGAGNMDSVPHVCLSGSSLAEMFLQPVPQTLLTAEELTQSCSLMGHDSILVACLLILSS